MARLPTPEESGPSEPTLRERLGFRDLPKRPGEQEMPAFVPLREDRPEDAE